jgi:DNA-binding NarL/FixJ family response regulator
VAVLKFQGYTNEEIADRLQRGLRTIERKLRVIRTKWSAKLCGEN